MISRRLVRQEHTTLVVDVARWWHRLFNGTRSDTSMAHQKSPLALIKPRMLGWLAVGLVIYLLLQPSINQRWGWNLPSLNAWLDRAADESEPSAESWQGASTPAVADENDVPAPPTTEEPRTETTEPPLRYDWLRPLGRDEYQSPAGLRYTRGSEEGHRLKHLAKHLQDQPDRPGRHGVFSGDMPQVLRWLDEAYTRGQSGQPGTRRRSEQARTIYEVSFDRELGYIGGREGRRLGHPTSRRLRLVVEQDRVITAFPF